MEARLYHAALMAASLLSLGASYRTQNFIVTAPTQQLAREVSDAAENYRHDLAMDWLGKELPPWPAPCPITIDVGAHLGAGGATSFMFENGRPFGWTMHIQGSRERILDSVLPHEVTHTLFATHFGRPLPRWADEGACTTVEHESEKNNQKRLLREFLTTGRGIAFNRMFAMKEYPQDVLPLYSQGYALARYLIAQGGRRKFVAYIGDGMRWNDWTRATREHYGYESLSELQLTWVDWVGHGSPPLPESHTLVAQQNEPAGRDTVPVRLASADRNAVPMEAAPVTRPVPDRPAEQQSGWYVRVRDQAVAQRRGFSTVEQAADRTQPTARSTPGRRQTPPMMRQAVSRPQPVTPASEVILK
ncbi:MAG: hypothetical protein ACC628_07955 [Pirellulaceae bacterium]